MPTDEKDRLGDKLRDVERGREDQYFAQRDRELIAKLRGAQDQASEPTLREIARGRCPKCGERLRTRALHGVTVDECPSCEGMWLERGELKLLAEREHQGWLARWFRGERES